MSHSQEDMKLQVLEIFDSIQGEGYWSGVPMSFVRLAGCNAPQLNLGCLRWCDTASSWDPRDGETLEISEVLARAKLPRICLTGGEPLLQSPSLKHLIKQAHHRGQKVHLETNGTLAPPEIAPDWAVVSPKPPDYYISAAWKGRIDELKLMADDYLDVQVAEHLAAAHPQAVLCVQPVDFPQKGTKAAASLDLALSLVMRHRDWRLSLQIHKLLNLP